MGWVHSLYRDQLQQLASGSRGGSDDSSTSVVGLSVVKIVCRGGISIGSLGRETDEKNVRPCAFKCYRCHCYKTLLEILAEEPSMKNSCVCPSRGFSPRALVWKAAGRKNFN
jgi:hypothetical protein